METPTGAGAIINDGDDFQKRVTVNPRYSINSLFEIISTQDRERGDFLEQIQSKITGLKKEISASSKKNFNLEKDTNTLDKKIALLIKNRISLEEVMVTSGDILEMLNERTISLKDQKKIQLYGELFFIIRTETKYIATLARLVKLSEIDNLLQTVMFTLYGNQYEENEEHLLLSMFQCVLREEFKLANGVAGLLRANTALTRMMTTYTRRGPGQQYLKVVLTDSLNKIVHDDTLLLEINPSKIYENFIIEQETTTGVASSLPKKVTTEQAAENPDVKRIVAERIKKLMDIAQLFFDSIIESINDVPYGIRWICKQIRTLTKEKFPEATKGQTCSLIGGFFLLRFLNPAIVTPTAFMLVEAKLSNNTRRNLTLLAKVLQNMANNIRFGGIKEFYMDPLNEFLEKNIGSLNDFLEDLTNVDDLDEQLNLDKYLSLGTTQDININITLNEMYFIHDLLNVHITEIEKNDQTRLKQILDELGTAPPQIPRKENANTELKLINNEIYTDGKDENQQLKPEQLYSETKYLLFTVLKAVPTLNSPDGDLKSTLRQIHSYASQNNDLELIEKIKKIILNCNQLVEQGMLAVEDNYSQLRKDTLQEVINFEEKILKIERDATALTKVIKAIHEHNNFLQQQFEAYTQYLENVRKSCATDAPKTKNSKKEKKTKNLKEKKKGPFKYSHVQLEKDGVIIESGVPEERRSNIFFSFSSVSPGIFDVAVLYRSRSISSMQLQLDELLEYQSNSQLELETDFLKLNINLLIYLLNKCFVIS